MAVGGNIGQPKVLEIIVHAIEVRTHSSWSCVSIWVDSCTTEENLRRRTLLAAGTFRPASCAPLLDRPQTVVSATGVAAGAAYCGNTIQ